MVKVTKIILENGDNKNCIIIPDGYVVDEVNSSDTEIKLVTDLRVNNNNQIVEVYSYAKDELLDYKTTVKEAFESSDMSATKNIAHHVEAINKISLILKYDVRFGGLITADEWKNAEAKYCINCLHHFTKEYHDKHFLAFHTVEQANLFLAEYKDLIDLYYSF